MIAHIEIKTNEQAEALKAFAMALKMKIRLEEDSSSYNPKFKMIKQGEQDLKESKGVNMTIEELQKLCK